MKPKEKAEELVNKMWLSMPTIIDLEVAIECALIAVEEQIKTVNWYAEMQMLTNWGNALKYWQEVKNEIEKL